MPIEVTAANTELAGSLLLVASSVIENPFWVTTVTAVGVSGPPFVMGAFASWLTSPPE